MEGVRIMNLECIPLAEDGDMPEWLLVEVLIRLPVKLVFRLKLVSKRWLSIISHPFLGRAYVSRASSLPNLQRWTFISRFMHIERAYISSEPLVDVYSCDLQSLHLYALPFPCIQHPVETKNIIFGVSNGLALYGPATPPVYEGNWSATYTICNPGTGQWIDLPALSSHVKELTHEVTGFITHIESNILMSYRVMCLRVTRGSEFISIDLFISETGEWTEFNVCINRVVRVECARLPFVLNGILHWMTYEHGILACDPYMAPDCLDFIALPKDTNQIFDDGTYIPRKCDAHEGRLRYFEVFHKNSPQLEGFSGIRVWMQNDYHKPGDWSLLHRVRFADISCDRIFCGIDLEPIPLSLMEPVPLSFDPFDPNIVYLGYKGAILSYNFKRRKIEVYDDPSTADIVDKLVTFRGSDLAWWWAQLFMIPPWPISIISPESSHSEPSSRQLSSQLVI